MEREKEKLKTAQLSNKKEPVQSVLEMEKRERLYAEKAKERADRQKQKEREAKVQEEEQRRKTMEKLMKAKVPESSLRLTKAVQQKAEAVSGDADELIK